MGQIDLIWGWKWVFLHLEGLKATMYHIYTLILQCSCHWIGFNLRYDSLSDVPESRVCFASKNLMPCRMPAIGKVSGIKIESTAANEFFYQSEMEIREKRNFFTLWPPARKRREISGWVQWVKWSLHIEQQMPCWQKVTAGPFWPCFAGAGVGRCR